MSFRQPQINYSAADAFRDATDHALKLALATIGDKKTEETNRVGLAIKRLSSLESQRNTIQVAWLEKQAQIAGYIGESDSLQDIYKTGKEGKLGSSVEDITADLYKDPFKYHTQAMKVTQNQIDVLGPAMASSIDKLAKLSQAQDFITKGIGATFKTGATGKEIAEWGPEDLSQAAFTGKFYPELEEGKEIPEELRIFFQRHQPDPITIAGLETKRKREDWEIEQRGIARAGEQRAKSAELRAQALHDFQTGKEKLPGDIETNKSLARMNIYNPMIEESMTGMLSASFGYANMLSGQKEQKPDLIEKGQTVFDAEAFRIGLIFNPAPSGDLGIDPMTIRNMSSIEFQDRYEELLGKKANDPKRIRAIQIKQLGEEIYHENKPTRMADPLDVKRGLVVPAYNDRDELIAQAYKRFSDFKKVSSTEAGKYADNIKYILGVDLRHEGTVRGILKEYFRTNYLESAIGYEGGYDTILEKNLTVYQKDLAGDFMELVKKNYSYDIVEDRWIEGWQRLADGTMVPEYE